MIAHYEFVCKGCGGPIILHAQTLGWPFEPQAARTTYASSVAVACYRCKQIRTYAGDKNSADYTPFQRRSPDRILETDPVILLKCAGENCRVPIWLFSPVTATMTAEAKAAEIESWIWDDLKCPAGHPILKSQNLRP